VLFRSYPARGVSSRAPVDIARVMSLRGLDNVDLLLHRPQEQLVSVSERPDDEHALGPERRRQRVDCAADEAAGVLDGPCRARLVPENGSLDERVKRLSPLA